MTKTNFTMLLFLLTILIFSNIAVAVPTCEYFGIKHIMPKGPYPYKDSPCKHDIGYGNASWMYTAHIIGTATYQIEVDKKCSPGEFILLNSFLPSMQSIAAEFKKLEQNGICKIEPLDCAFRTIDFKSYENSIALVLLPPSQATPPQDMSWPSRTTAFFMNTTIDVVPPDKYIQPSVYTMYPHGIYQPVFDGPDAQKEKRDISALQTFKKGFDQLVSEGICKPTAPKQCDIEFGHRGRYVDGTAYPANIDIQSPLLKGTFQYIANMMSGDYLSEFQSSTYKPMPYVQNIFKQSGFCQ